jgi:hypothetical protein
MAKPKASISIPKIMVLVIWGVDEPAPVEIVHQICALAPITYVNLQFPIWKPIWKHIVQNRASKISYSIGIMPQHIQQKWESTKSANWNEPDLTSSIFSWYWPCDFFLFRDLKHKLQGCSYDSKDEFFFAIMNLIENLKKSLRHRVFDERITCLHLVVESGGEYIQTY